MSPNNNVVLVTRPAAQAAGFIQLLKESGINASAFPCIEIQAIELNESLQRLLGSLQRFDFIIFISANAVEHAANVLHQCGIQPESITAKIATIGKATRNTANQLGFKVSISPDNGFNSDALLALNAFQEKHIKNRQCLIFRGVGGLNYLADELQKRGAQVRYAEVYKRCQPSHDQYLARDELSHDWKHFNISVITATSNESIQNLYDMITTPGKIDMLETRLIVASLRGVKLAQALGFTSIKCAQSAINRHMLQAIEIELK